MRIPRIYTAQPLDSGIALSLEPEPSHHLTRVLRMGAGDALVLFDGTGGEYPAEITDPGKKRVEVRAGTFREGDNESPLHIHLVSPSPAVTGWTGSCRSRPNSG